MAAAHRFGAFVGYWFKRIWCVRRIKVNTVVLLGSHGDDIHSWLAEILGSRLETQGIRNTVRYITERNTLWDMHKWFLFSNWLTLTELFSIHNCRRLYISNRTQYKYCVNYNLLLHFKFELPRLMKRILICKRCWAQSSEHIDKNTGNVAVIIVTDLKMAIYLAERCSLSALRV